MSQERETQIEKQLTQEKILIVHIAIPKENLMLNKILSPWNDTFTNPWNR